MEFLCQVGTPFEILKYGDAPLPLTHIVKPYIIAMTPDHNIFEKGHVVKDAVDSFNSKFATSSLRTGQGRAERTLKGPALEAAAALANTIVTESERLPFGKMHAELGPSAYGIAAGQDLSYCLSHTSICTIINVYINKEKEKQTFYIKI